MENTIEKCGVIDCKNTVIINKDTRYYDEQAVCLYHASRVDN